MRARALTVVAVGLVLAGCASSGPTKAERNFGNEMADAGLVVGESMATLDACSDAPCLEQRGAAAKTTIAGQVARIARDLRSLHGGCFASAGRSFLASLHEYETAADLASRGREDASMAAESRAGTLTTGSVDAFAACTHTPQGSTSLSHALLAVQQQIGVIDRCQDIPCLDREGAALRRIADHQQRVVDAHFSDEAKCAGKARDPVDRGFDAVRRVAGDVRNGDETAAQADAVRSEDLFNQAGRAYQNCLH